MTFDPFPLMRMALTRRSWKTAAINNFEANQVDSLVAFRKPIEVSFHQSQGPATQTDCRF